MNNVMVMKIQKAIMTAIANHLMKPREKDIYSNVTLTRGGRAVKFDCKGLTHVISIESYKKEN